jgi:hypothetical protein
LLIVSKKGLFVEVFVILVPHDAPSFRMEFPESAAVDTALRYWFAGVLRKRHDISCVKAFAPPNWYQGIPIRVVRKPVFKGGDPVVTIF